MAHHDETGRGVERSARLSADRNAPQRYDADGRGEVSGLADGAESRLGADLAAERNKAIYGAGQEQLERYSGAGRVGDTGGAGSRLADGTESRLPAGSVRSIADESQSAGADGLMGGTGGAGLAVEQRESGASQQASRATPWQTAERAGPSVLWCRDGKWRPVEPGAFPLAHGVPGRVGLLRGYGNAIVPQVAAAFIEATGLV